MAVISKKGAQALKEQTLKEDGYGKKLADDLMAHFTEYHSLDRVWDRADVETLLLKQKQREIDNLGNRPTYPRNLVKFNPSGASSSVMDLYLKAKGYKEKRERYPYQNRWTRNSTAVHEAVQRDLLYAEKVLSDPLFVVERTDEGLPAWEDNVLKWVKLEHKGRQFILNGKMDGILIHKPTGKRVGFELKTKSNTLGQVGHYKLKEAASYHVEQCVAYYLLTGVRDYIITYEGVAKPQWSAGAEAKPDLRTFHTYVTDEMAEALLDKWAYVTECVETDTPPEDKELGFFSGYHYLFEEGTV